MDIQNVQQHRVTTQEMIQALPPAVRCSGGHIDAIKVLLDAGADVNDTTPNGMPALHLAINNAHWELAMISRRMGLRCASGRPQSRGLQRARHRPDRSAHGNEAKAVFSRSNVFTRGSVAVGFRPRFFGVKPCARCRRQVTRCEE